MTARIKYFLSLFTAVVVLGTLTACEDDEPVGGDVIVLQKGSGDGAIKGLLEVPELRPSNIFVSHFTKVAGKDVMTYCYEFDKTKMHTRWVAYRFDAITRQSNTSRSDAWADDPELPEVYRIGTSYFNGYQRGHICPSADRLYSVEANMQTFYMSNMSPQIGDFNGGAWAGLEDLVRDCGRSSTFADTIYVVKGGTIENDQIRTYMERSSSMKIAVPRYYFVALLAVKAGSYSSIGFLMEHKNYPDYNSSLNEKERKAFMEQFAMSIDKLEDLTGINFFSNLPEVTEETVEASYMFSKWNL